MSDEKETKDVVEETTTEEAAPAAEEAKEETKEVEVPKQFKKIVVSQPRNVCPLPPCWKSPMFLATERKTS